MKRPKNMAQTGKGTDFAALISSQASQRASITLKDEKVYWTALFQWKRRGRLLLKGGRIGVLDEIRVKEKQMFLDKFVALTPALLPYLFRDDADKLFGGLTNPHPCASTGV